jgi:hypothetical protein
MRETSVSSAMDDVFDTGSTFFLLSLTHENAVGLDSVGNVP